MGEAAVAGPQQQPVRTAQARQGEAAARVATVA